MTRFGFRCDAGPRTGVGHLVRCVALAEELTRRGVDVRFLSDLGGLPWARLLLDDRGLAWTAPPATAGALASTAVALGLDAVVLDSYELSPEHGAQLRAGGRTVLAIVDGDLRGQQADLYLDQNLDAEHSSPPLPPGAVRLAGLPYTLLRDAVRSRRPARPRLPEAARTPRVVCFFGGTDAYRAAPTVGRLLVSTAARFDATVVAADDGLRAEVAALPVGAGQRIDVIAPTDELPALLADADLAVSASGTSTWELLCLGVPAALVWVVDNQELGYRRTVDRGLAVGLGHLPALVDGGPEHDRAGALLHRLLTDARWRADLGRRAWQTVDGRGVARVADELLGRLDAAADAVTPGRASCGVREARS
jgi:spore coat polysaccharide biosynthesis predicted glycosyltransferase SpsG